jgi:hypothetical protein
MRDTGLAIPRCSKTNSSTTIVGDCSISLEDELSLPTIPTTLEEDLEDNGPLEDQSPDLVLSQWSIAVIFTIYQRIAAHKFSSAREMLKILFASSRW